MSIRLEDEEIEKSKYEKKEDFKFKVESIVYVRVLWCWVGLLRFFIFIFTLYQESYLIRNIIVFVLFKDIFFIYGK